MTCSPRDRLQPGRGPAHPRSSRPHLLGRAGLRGPRGITAYVHPGDREMLADPAKGLSTEPDRAVRRAAAVHRAGRRGRAARRRHDHGGRAGDHRRPRARAHPAGRCCSGCPAPSGHLLCRACARRGMRRAVPLRRCALRRVDRADRPARRVDGRRCCVSLRDKILPLDDDDRGAARPRAGDHDRPRARAPTRTCSRSSIGLRRRAARNAWLVAVRRAS